MLCSLILIQFVHGETESQKLSSRCQQMDWRAGTCQDPSPSLNQYAVVSESTVVPQIFMFLLNTLWVGEELPRKAVVFGNSAFGCAWEHKLSLEPHVCFAAGTWRLKQLLSFALGGLLGNVFLHLLPEAWAYTCRISPGE